MQALQRVRPYIRQDPESEQQKASSKAAAVPENVLDQEDAAGFAAIPAGATAAEGADLAIPASAAGTDAEAAAENGSGGTCGEIICMPMSLTLSGMDHEMRSTCL